MVRIQHGLEAHPCSELRRETRLVAVNVALKVSDSNESNARRGSNTEAGESNELVSIIDTSRIVGSKGVTLGDIGSNFGISSYFGEVGGGCRKL